MTTLDPGTSLTVNSATDFFSANFTKYLEHSCLLNHLQEHILSISKSEHLLKSISSSFENCVYLKLKWFSLSQFNSIYSIFRK